PVYPEAFGSCPISILFSPSALWPGIFPWAHPIFTQPIALCGHGIHWIILRPDGTFGSVGPRNRRLPIDLDRVLLGLVDFVVTIRWDLHRPHFTRQDHPPIYF